MIIPHIHPQKRPLPYLCIMNTKYKALLIDVMALLYRAHFALIRSPRISAKGVNTNALFGFTNTLASIWAKEAPTHIIAAMDPNGPTWRSEVYPAYKAHRQRQPEDITIALSYLPRLLEALQIPIIQHARYEADDIIGTLARKGIAQGAAIYMVTSDKDLAQLVDKAIYWYKLGARGNKESIWGVEEVCSHWGIEKPSQVQDTLALCGDSVDNIPGVPHIGEKGAQKLLKQFGSIEEILKKKALLSPRLQELLERYGEQALLSKRLATISTDIPLTFDFAQKTHPGIDSAKTADLFNELSFRTLTQRLLQHDKTTPTLQLSLISTETDSQTDHLASIANTPTLYHTISTLEQCEELVTKLESHSLLTIDTEATGLDPLQAELLGISLASHPREAYYIPLGQGSPLSIQHISPLLKRLLQHRKILKVGQNLKYDLHLLRRHGIDIQGPFFDTMIAHHLLYPAASHGLDAMAELHLHYKPIPIEALIGPKGSGQKSLSEVPLDKVSEYACEDADITLQLYHKLAPQIEEEKLAPLFYTIEMPLLAPLVAMEAAGVAIDTDALLKSSKVLEREIEKYVEEINGLAGERFNVDSPKQLGKILFDKLAIITNPLKTGTGQYATNEAVLSKLAGKHPIIDKLRAYRELRKLKSTYIDAFPKLVNQETGRLHTSYHQGIVSTGRLSSSKPNLQNIPIRTERGRMIREAFIPSSQGGFIFSADYSQIELRLMAHFSEDPALIEAFTLGKDIHLTTAAKIFRIAEEEVTDVQRQQAKMVNFSIIYGISPFGLAERLSIPRKEAKAIIDAHFENFSGVKQYMESVIAETRERGWVTTLFGRKRPLPDINSRHATLRGFAERNAVNMPIQGTQAEMIKKAMIEIYQWIASEALHSKMTMQVHDELVFDVVAEERALLAEKVPLLMEQVLPLRVPVVVHTGVGHNWLAAHG